MTTRRPISILIAAIITIGLLPTLSSFAPGGQVGGFTTAAPAAADQIWYQSVGRSSATAPCEKSTTTELAAGWTNWGPSWDTWVNEGKGGFVCNRQITWAFDSVPPSSSGSTSLCRTTRGGSTPTPCALGTFGPGGGIVFYVDESQSTGSRYLEAAPNTWSGGAADPALAWCSDVVTLIAGTFGTAIGTGNANTNLMVNGVACTSSTGAANSVRAYAGNLTAGSWFLPSKDELNQLCKYARGQSTSVANKAVVCNNTGALLPAFLGTFYWSSSQADATNAQMQSFGNGDPSSTGKVSLILVRPVRAF